MKTNAKLLLVGISPLAIGLIQSKLIRHTSFFSLISPLGAIIFLFLWGYLCRRVTSPDRKPLPQLVLLHTPAALMLVLVLIEQFVMERPWPVVGYLSQTFFLPFLSLGSAFNISIHNTVYVWIAFVLTFLLMVLSGFLGCRRKNRT